ncbi:hypothetical protein D9611_011034 [Ephemerocybe angulata]|uniref:FBD domain-containing protein n=1 Tax=Ephemerocybe angulata TaxID=980116 RepID=A0A8H5F177_9AGAR|nr:hypothetical protein D9611_011034 [Tulosesus angulatus]
MEASHDADLPRPCDNIRAIEVDFVEIDRDGSEAPSPPPGTFLSNLLAITSLRLCLGDAGGIFTDAAESLQYKLNIAPSCLERLPSFDFSSSWYGTHVLDALQHCNNLQTLKINLRAVTAEQALFYPSDGPFKQYHGREEITMAKLHTLQVQMDPRNEILLHIKAPSLVNFDARFHPNLKQRSVYTVHEIGKSHFYLFLELSGCKESLRTFGIHDIMTSSEVLSIILAALPSLVHITLDNVYIGDHKTLWRSLSGCTFLNLKVLELLRFGRTEDGGMIADEMLKFFEQRGKQPCQVFLAFRKAVDEALDVSNRFEMPFRRRIQGSGKSLGWQSRYSLLYRFFSGNDSPKTRNRTFTLHHAFVGSESQL